MLRKTVTVGTGQIWKNQRQRLRKHRKDTVRVKIWSGNKVQRGKGLERGSMWMKKIK